MMSKEVDKSKIKIIQFKCRRCGECCIHLTGERVDNVGVLGLFLTPVEARLFPKNHVVPLYGIGVKGRSRPRPATIIAYQLDLDLCPHFGADKRCRIYAQRPSMCRSFPLEGVGIASSACPALGEQLDFEGQRFRLIGASAQNEVKASHKSAQYLQRYLGQSASLWIWPLNKKRWIKKNRYDAQRIWSASM